MLAIRFSIEERCALAQKRSEIDHGDPTKTRLDKGPPTIQIVPRTFSGSETPLSRGDLAEAFPHAYSQTFPKQKW